VENLQRKEYGNARQSGMPQTRAQRWPAGQNGGHFPSLCFT